MTNVEFPMEPGRMDKAEAEAARFFARQMADNHSTSDRKKLEAWLEESPENIEAFRRQQELWSEIGEASADAEILAMRNSALAYQKPRKRQLSWSHGMAIAASLAVFAISLSVFLIPSNQPVRHPDRSATPELVSTSNQGVRPTIYRTQTGQRSTINLADGSVVELNTDSLIQVTYNNEFRQLVLLRGEAFFDVAKDPNRPFVVMANDKRVVAVGTEFSVRLDGDRVSVTLVKGVVSVDRANSDGEFVPGAGGEAQIMKPGEQLVALESQPFRKTAIDTAIATSWRNGRIVFENEPLSRVVPELNRYTTRKLVIGSESLADMRVSGSFRAGSSDHFAKTLQATFPVRVEAKDDQIVLNWSE